jgi:sulfur-oxidizing protein SoxY
MPAMLRRRAVLTLLAAIVPAAAAHAQSGGDDPFGSLQWPDLRREFFGAARVVFDERVQVRGPAFAEDPMNVPISVSAIGLPDVETLVVFVDRNPIRKVLEYQPLAALTSLGFRFKLEQASPVRAAARTKDGVWHVGGTLVDSAGGGCTVAGASRKDGSWTQTLGQARGKLFASSPVGGADASRLRVMVMHPMDTGLVGGIPAFYVNKLAVRDAQGRELLRLATFEPVSENPVFSFDFPGRVAGGLRLTGTDNNGNRIDSRIE